jgi:hypothetical protein
MVLIGLSTFGCTPTCVGLPRHRACKARCSLRSRSHTTLRRRAPRYALSAARRRAACSCPRRATAQRPELCSLLWMVGGGCLGGEWSVFE